MEEKAEEILNKTNELFLSYGIKSITMDEVAARLGISKKTLYHFVQNKSDLVYQTISYFIEGQKQEITTINNENLNSIDELARIYQRICFHLSEMNPNVFFDLQRFFPESWDVYIKYKWGFMFDHIMNNLEKGIGEGFYRKDLNKRIIAKYYVARIDIFLDKDIFSPREYSYKDILKELLIYHLRGIATHQGIYYLENHADLNF